MAQIDTGPTLTNITAIGRQVVKYGLILLVAMIVGRTLLTAFSNYWQATHPPPPPPPTMGFGILPPIEFPEQTEADKPSSYQLEMATGRFPSFGDRAKVFLMTKNNLSLLADQRVREIASDYGYVFAPQVINGTLYRWNKSQPLESTLEINSENFTMDVNSDFKSRPELLSTGRLPEAGAAESRIKAFLSTAGLLSRDVATAEAQIRYLKLLGNDLEPAASFSDADFIQVDLNRVQVDGVYGFCTPDGESGVISGIVSGGLNGNDSVVQLINRYFNVDYSQVETYPLRSPDSAWRILQSGEGFIANKGTRDTAVIRNVNLCYFESPNQQDFLQPIFVFSGDNGFIGYVPALDPRVYITATSQQ